MVLIFLTDCPIHNKVKFSMAGRILMKNISKNLFKERFQFINIDSFLINFFHKYSLVAKFKQKLIGMRHINNKFDILLFLSNKFQIINKLGLKISLWNPSIKYS